MAGAAVPSLLLLVLFEGSRGWPGLLYLEPDRGLYGLSGLVYTGPDWLLHGWLFAAFTVFNALLLGAAAALDRDGLAADSLRWACRPRGIRLLMGAALICSTALVLLPHAAAEMLGIVAALLALPLMALAPFLSGNPATLTRPTLSHWWRPWWPGGRVLWWILPLWLLAGPVAQWALSGFGHALGLGDGPTVALVLLPGSVIDMALMLAIAALWFGHRGWRSFASAIRTLLRWRVLRAVFAFHLYLWCVGLVCALPVLIVASYRVYAMPQFDSVSRHSAMPTTWAQDLLLSLHVSSAESYLVCLLIIGVALPLSFSSDRLLFAHGLGGQLGPESPRSRGAGERDSAS